MKIAISALGNELSSKMDPKFGRAQGFIVYDSETGSSEYHPNADNIQLAQGAGIKTAQFIADLDVKKIISGHFGPKAASVLEKADIEMVNGDPAKTVGEIINDL